MVLYNEEKKWRYRTYEAKNLHPSVVDGSLYAVIQGVKKGKTTLLARYKQGKKIRKLTCRITVLAAKKATPQKNAAVPTSTASPSQAPNSSPAITPTPEPTATPTPTWVTTWGTAEEKCDVTSNYFRRFHGKADY